MVQRSPMLAQGDLHNSVLPSNDGLQRESFMHAQCTASSSHCKPGHAALSFTFGSSYQLYFRLCDLNQMTWANICRRHLRSNLRMLSIDFLRLSMYMSTLVQWKIWVLGIYIKLSRSTEKRKNYDTEKRKKCPKYHYLVCGPLSRLGG